MDPAFEAVQIHQKRIEELEKGLEQLRSQLIDGQFPIDSIIILAIDNLLNND